MDPIVEEPENEIEESKEAIQEESPPVNVKVELPETILSKDDNANKEGPSGSISSDDNDPGSVYSFILPELPVPYDFFASLGDVPSISKIVESESEESSAEEPEEIATVAATSGPALEQAAEPIDDIQEPTKEDADEDASEEEEDDDEDLLEADIEPIVPKKAADFEDVFEALFVEKKDKTDDALIAELERREREEAARQIQIHTAEFLDNLISRIVHKCEYIDAMTVLRMNLDKMKLMSDIYGRTQQIEVEQKTRAFVNRKTAEFYRRKKAFRAITEDPPEIAQKMKLKLKTASNALDRALGKDDETRELLSLKEENLEDDLFDWEVSLKQAVKSMEELFRKTLYRDTFERMPTVVDSQLRRMASVTDEISIHRLKFLKYQHSYAVLLEKLQKLENLGNNLHMPEFEKLQVDVLLLEKKIEDRTSELVRLRERCNLDIHIQAHMKEKKQMMRTTICLQEDALKELLSEKYSYREYIYTIKLKRDLVRKEITDLSLNAGLLNKIELLYDYDDTTVRVDKLRAKVEQMRSKLAYILKKIAVFE